MFANIQEEDEVAIRDNNRAVSLIQCGQHEKAIELLSGALASYKRLFSETAVQEETTGSKQPIETEEDYAHGFLDHCLIKSRLDPMCKELGTGHYVFSEGIHIVRPPLDCETPSNRRIIEASTTIIIFNLAISHHMLVTKFDDGRRRLMGALKLYQLVLQFQGDEIGESNLLFTLTVVNNIGVIQNQIQETHPSSIRSFEFLLSMLVQAVARGERHGSLLEGFLTNAICVLAKPSCSLAAAA